MAAPKFDAIKGDYARLWRTMTLGQARIPAFQATAKRLMKGMPRYKAVEAATGVPAALIAILHDRESGGDFDTYLGNGQSIHKKTTIVPKGRGPFRNFEEGAIDALSIDGLSDIKDWSLEMILFKAEAFNGFGYRYKGLRSPYLWGGTNHQQPGKYVSDGVLDATVMDPQLGAAGVLFTLFNLDLSLMVKLSSPATATQPPAGRPPAPPPAFPAPRPPSQPAATQPGKKEAVAGIAAIIATGFAYVMENPWLLVGGVLVIAGAFVAYAVLKKD